MKQKTIFFLILFFGQLFISPIVAASPTPKPTETKEASDEAEIKTIEKIKDMVADKVSKLNLVEKRGLIGEVTDTSTTQITVKDIAGKKRFIDIDELTKFQDSIGSSKTFGISDIKKGDRLAFVGQYNKDTERLLARFVTKTVSIPSYIHGTVDSVDEAEFQIVVVDKNGKKMTVDIERSTVTTSYESENGSQKSGFSKIEIGQRVIVAGFPDADTANIIAASRILHFIEASTTLFPTPDDN